MNSEKLKKMIGQMVMVGFRGTDVSDHDEIIKDLHKMNLCGVILFDYDVETGGRTRNIIDQKQVIELNRTLQCLAQNSLLIAIDQEGGNVARLKPDNGYAKSLSAEELGRLNNIKTTLSTAKLIAGQVAESGFNLNFAPVIDLNVNKNNPIISKPGRSISADPEKVVEYAEIFISEHRKQNVLTCVKHFMGHGSSDTDSHLGIVNVTGTYNLKEKIPYEMLIKKGLIDMVMTAHLYNRNIDTSYPFTLSRQVITNILRKEMGFNGVVISDDMQMKAITELYGFKQALSLALDAGIDIILIPNNLIYEPDAHIRAVETIFKYVNSGQCSLHRIEESFTRVKKLKEKVGIKITL